jgi:hypothetical protein
LKFNGKTNENQLEPKKRISIDLKQDTNAQEIMRKACHGFLRRQSVVHEEKCTLRVAEHINIDEWRQCKYTYAIEFH